MGDYTFQFLVLTRTYVSVLMNPERSRYEGYGPGFDFSFVSSNVEVCRYAKMTTRMHQLKTKNDR